MNVLHLEEDLHVFGFPVTAFPNGIGETFEQLMNLLPEGKHRQYYGVSFWDGQKMVYLATVLAKYQGEAKRYACEEYNIEKGTYASVTIADWHKKTDTIKDVFKEMLKDNRVDNTKPAVEWYKNDTEMMCMMRLRS